MQLKSTSIEMSTFHDKRHFTILYAEHIEFDEHINLLKTIIISIMKNDINFYEIIVTFFVILSAFIWLEICVIVFELN